MSNCVLLVGLGNPGAEYENNRHNVGFKIIEAVADSAASNSFKKIGGVAEITSFSLEHTKFILAKPSTFMNLSGRAVRFLMDFYKLPLPNIYVFHDDIDLPFGRVKIKNGGGNGGHNGLKSIDSLAGVEYWRIRIGVGRPLEKSMVVSHVLGNFPEEQISKIENISQIIAQNLMTLISKDNKKLEQLINA